jgi:L-fuconolactonase
MFATMRIDSHQHFWNYDAKEYPWITEKLGRIRRDFLPGDLKPELEKFTLNGSIVVQARSSLTESRWLLNLADHYPSIKGVVGWVDLLSEKAEEQLAEFAKHPKFVGVRHVVQDEPDDEFMLRPEFLRGIGKLKQFKLTYDILIYPKQLPAAIKLVEKFPEQKFVLDHLAKPFIKTGELSPWDQQIRVLAGSKNVCCKVSGVVTEAKWNEWKASDFRPYLDVVFEAFGEGRLMFGSDWPVCLLSGSYEQVIDIVRDYLAKLPEDVSRKVMGENAARFYGILN